MAINRQQGLGCNVVLALSPAAMMPATHGCAALLCCWLVCAGVILFQLSSDTEPVSEDTRVMEIFISGDACISIYTHLCPSDNTRPMALDILWQVGAALPWQEASTATAVASQHRTRLLQTTFPQK